MAIAALAEEVKVIVEPEWERYAINTHRIKVDGGFVYRTTRENNSSICFVPDVDLQRYQSHLRDAYRKGYADGQEDAKNGIVNSEEGLTAYPEEGSL